MTNLTELEQAMLTALCVCQRVIGFDLRRMVEWGPEYNQAVKDAYDVVCGAIHAAQTKDTSPQETA
jgi:hypothetical protein